MSNYSKGKMSGSGRGWHSSNSVGKSSTGGNDLSESYRKGKHMGTLTATAAIIVIAAVGVLKKASKIG